MDWATRDWDCGLEEACKGVYNDGKWIVHGKLMETIMETPAQTPMGPPGRGQAEGSKTTQFRPGHPGRQRGGRRHRLPSQLLRDMASRTYRKNQRIGPLVRSFAGRC